MEIDQGDREYLNEMRSLTTDSQGRTCYAGLTHEESSEFHALVHKRDKLYAEKSRYLELHDKHELVRLSIIGTEASLRANPQPLH